MKTLLTDMRQQERHAAIDRHADAIRTEVAGRVRWHIRSIGQIVRRIEEKLNKETRK